MDMLCRDPFVGLNLLFPTIHEGVPAVLQDLVANNEKGAKS